MTSVMVVADDSWVDNDIRSALTEVGMTVETVTDPREAVSMAGTSGAEVAVVDLQVGSMGGMAVVRALRSAVEFGEIGPLRTVMLLDRRADTFLARRAGADVAVIKPFTAQELRAAAALPAQV